MLFDDERAERHAASMKAAELGLKGKGRSAAAVAAREAAAATRDDDAVADFLRSQVRMSHSVLMSLH
jgi:hypothetical protein